ncbi:MAG TPA: hypothetical protein VI111_03055, partial [Thermoleophilaceae bacterium]
MTSRDRHGSASLEESTTPRERTATVVSVAVDCTPEALRTAVAGHAGELVEREDTLLAEFESVGGALAAALLAQERAREGRGPRIGIAHGAVVRREGQLEGPAGDEALELVRRARRGEVLASDVVHALGRGT